MGIFVQKFQNCEDPCSVELHSKFLTIIFLSQRHQIARNSSWDPLIDILGLRILKFLDRKTWHGAKAKRIKFERTIFSRQTAGCTVGYLRNDKG